MAEEGAQASPPLTPPMDSTAPRTQAAQHAVLRRPPCATPRLPPPATSLNAGAHLRDVPDFARHADPKTTMRYDRNRHSLDRHATYAITQYIAGSE